jgi:putative tryptophan/tyrosine transport system substrate-binding protein
VNSVRESVSSGLATAVGRGRSLIPTDAAAAGASAASLVQRRPDIIVTWGTVGAVAVKQAGNTAPHVFLSVGVPVEIDLIPSLAQPGGNITGVTFEAANETYGKRLQLLKEIAPKLSRAAILYAVGDPNVDHALSSAERAASPHRLVYVLTGSRSRF